MKTYTLWLVTHRMSPDRLVAADTLNEALELAQEAARVTLGRPEVTGVRRFGGPTPTVTVAS